MIEVQELSDGEILGVLKRQNYGHLACAKNNEPYVVPVHFAFHEGEIFIYTTEGKKSAIIDTNPRICLQAEEVTDNENWQSIIIDGVAERIRESVERHRILKIIAAINPTLTPAVSIHWMDNWVRENIEVVYRVKPTMMSGRRATNSGS